MNTRPINFINKSLLLLVFSPIFFLVACSKDTNSNIDCTGVTPTYTTGVKSILDGSCATSGCHDAITHQSGYDFSTYESAKVASQGGRFLGLFNIKVAIRQCLIISLN
jgi:hypothetical protein